MNNEPQADTDQGSVKALKYSSELKFGLNGQQVVIQTDRRALFVGIGERKLAADRGRAKQKSGGESQKDRTVTRGSGGRTGSSKQKKG